MLERIASALNASAAELFGSESEIQAHSYAGFEETPSAYVIKTPGIDGSRRLSERARHHQTWRAARTHLAFGILKGDEIHIDLADRHEEGDLVLATKVDLDTGSGVTLLRRTDRRGLVSEDPADAIEAWSGPTHNFAVLGKVIGIIRSI